MYKKDWIYFRSFFLNILTFAKKKLKTYHSIKDFQSIKKTIVTIGTFDGVHVGHQKILQKVKTLAQKESCESVVLTFFPHPRMVLQQDNSIKLLNTINEKTKLFEKIGIDHLIIHPFNKEFSELSAEDFVKIFLVHQLNSKKIVIGYDHRFGKNRTADLNDLIEFGKQLNFDVEEISVEEINDSAVSSTKVRNALLEGKIRKCCQLFGLQLFYNRKVVKGKQLGRTIGFPTANILIEESYKLVPKNGVYIVKTIMDSVVVFGMMNIGTRPTVDGKNQTIEVYFINFDKEIYDTTLTIEFLKFIRNEQKFDSLENLKIQIEKDKIQTTQFISTHF